MVELLIVIVILGILATVTVFAIRGISEDGEASACAIDMRNLQTANEAYWAVNGSYATEGDLVTAGSLRDPSTLYDVTLSGDGYAIAPAAGSMCTDTIDTDSGAGAIVVPVVDLGAAPSNFHGLPAFKHGQPADNRDVVIVGGAEAEADWELAVNVNGIASSLDVTYIRQASIPDIGALQNAISQSQNTAETYLVLYPGDGDPVLPGTTDPLSVYLPNSMIPGDEYHELAHGTANDLSALLTALG